jgi:NTE family protein
VLPTGQPDPPRYTDLSQFRYRDTAAVSERIARAHAASARYLAERGIGAP